MNLRIQITIQDKIGHTEVHPVNVDVEMLEDGPMIIDDVEREILRINRDVIRNTISAYLLEELSKKPDLREELMAAWPHHMAAFMPSVEKLTGSASEHTIGNHMHARHSWNNCIEPYGIAAKQALSLIASQPRVEPGSRHPGISRDRLQTYPDVFLQTDVKPGFNSS